MASRGVASRASPRGRTSIAATATVALVAAIATTASCAQIVGISDGFTAASGGASSAAADGASSTSTRGTGGATATSTTSTATTSSGNTTTTTATIASAATGTTTGAGGGGGATTTTTTTTTTTATTGAGGGATTTGTTGAGGGGPTSCGNHVCLPGEVCANGNQCCATACDGPCQDCASGSCLPLPAGDNAACAPACTTGDDFITEPACDGAGRCVRTSCGAFLCRPTMGTCGTCTNAGDPVCASPDEYCDGQDCVSKGAPGDDCSFGYECSSGICVRLQCA